MMVDGGLGNGMAWVVAYTFAMGQNAGNGNSTEMVFGWFGRLGFGCEANEHQSVFGRPPFGARSLSLSVTLFGSLGFYIVCAFYIAKIYMMFACCCCLLGCSCRIYSNMVDGCTLYCIIVWNVCIQQYSFLSFIFLLLCVRLLFLFFASFFSILFDASISIHRICTVQCGLFGSRCCWCCCCAAIKTFFMKL